MKNDLSKIQSILLTLKSMISKNQKIIKSISPNSDDYLQKKESYAYIHEFANDIRQEEKFLKEEDKEKKSLNAENSLETPNIFFEQASKFYNEWLSQEKPIKYRYNIIEPPTNEMLLDYLHLLAQKIDPSICLKNEKFTLQQRIDNYTYPHKNYIVSLRSFCHYLRNKYLINIEGFLNVIFPEKWDIKDKRIIRRITNQNFPIDYFNMSQIIKSFIFHILNGPKQSQYGYAQALGLCWVCIASSSFKTLTNPSLLHGIILNNLLKEENEKFLLGSNEYYSNKYNYQLITPSLFGEEKSLISELLYKYLLELGSMSNKYIFPYSFDSLSRILRSVIKKTAMTISKEDISFSTFIIQPHDVIGHRAKLKK